MSRCIGIEALDAILKAKRHKRPLQDLLKVTKSGEVLVRGILVGYTREGFKK